MRGAMREASVIVFSGGGPACGGAVGGEGAGVVSRRSDRGARVPISSDRTVDPSERASTTTTTTTTTTHRRGGAHDDDAIAARHGLDEAVQPSGAFGSHGVRSESARVKYDAVATNSRALQLLGLPAAAASSFYFRRRTVSSSSAPASRRARREQRSKREERRERTNSLPRRLRYTRRERLRVRRVVAARHLFTTDAKDTFSFPPGALAFAAARSPTSPPISSCVPPNPAMSSS